MAKYTVSERAHTALGRSKALPWQCILFASDCACATSKKDIQQSNITHFSRALLATKMSCATVKDVPAYELIRAYAKLLKKNGKLSVPKWVDIVKTGIHKELSPYEQDWYYIRCAAIARHIYLRPGVGVGAIKKVYGGAHDRGTKPSRHIDGSGSVARHCMKSLGGIKVLEEHPDGGRRITSTGQSDLDRIAGQVMDELKKKSA